jgi:asparagine synthase (glutamine-hydrolysing)
MCGIALIIGPAPCPALFDSMLDAIAPRGEVRETLSAGRHRLGTQRLKIVDRDRAIQPWNSADGRWAACYNGEIYNFRSLRSELAGLGHVLRSGSDTEVVLEAFLEWGEHAVHRLRGEFAFAIVDKAADQVYLARDPLGVKPLYWSRHDGHLYAASELKALVPAGGRVREIPPGHHGWGSPAQDPAVSAYVDLPGIGDGEEPVADVAEAARQVRAALEDSIRVRVDTDLTVGVVLSGGLDSTLTLLHVREMHPDCVAFTIGAPGSDDISYARRVTRDLGVDHEVIELAPGDIRLRDIREAIRMSELTEYGDVINAVISRLLFARVRSRGIKVVLCGDGSDELFGGYEMYQHPDPAARQRLFQYKLRNLGRTELQRVDRTSMGQGVEARVPFLDLALVRLAMRLPIELKLRDGQDKWILRHAFADILPGYVRQRPKNPLSHSSGLHERVRLYRSQFPRIYRSLGYDRLGPMRRDFSIVLGEHGLDLDRALRDIDARPDYSIADHARDLAGALRWNAAGVLRRRSHRLPGKTSHRPFGDLPGTAPGAAIIAGVRRRARRPLEDDGVHPLEDDGVHGERDDLAAMWRSPAPRPLRTRAAPFPSREHGRTGTTMSTAGSGTPHALTARQKRVWDKAAPGYDRQIAFFEKTWFAGGREWLGERARGRVLEVAVGTGRSLPFYPAGAAITGIELSPAMLAIARQRAAGLGREADLREGDAGHLPFGGASFDTVVCALALCTIPDPAAALGEMRRVLIPGGRLLLLDHVGSTWPPLYAAQWLLERVTARTAGEHFTRRQLPLVTAAGFQIVEAERLKAGTVERIHAVKPA